jgi:hypothetical protein
MTHLDTIDDGHKATRQGWRVLFPILSAMVVLYALVGCAASGRTDRAVPPPIGMVDGQNQPFRAHRWIEEEIRQFLGQDEVRDGLGFDPLSYETPFTVTLLEQRLSDRGIFRMFGRAANQDVFIQARLFVNPASPETGPDAALALDPDTARKANMLRILAADSDMRVLYRNLLICHEVAHVGEWYALTQRGALVRYTGHGVSNRAEIRILTRLLQAGKVRPAVFTKLFLFYATFMNQEAEPEGDLARTYRQALEPPGALAGGHDRGASLTVVE